MTTVEELIPRICKQEFLLPASRSRESFVLGIDEAGRGPVLGPMVYGAAWCPETYEQSLRQKFGVNDSKQLTEGSRDSILCSMLASSEADAPRSICCAVRVLSPAYLSAEMLAPDRMSLNEVSFRAAFGLLRTALDAGIPVAKVFVDTVGDPDKYREKFEREFLSNPEIKFVVSKKADSLFPIVGAASIVAKVVRDGIVHDWPFMEPVEGAADVSNVGSGYPGDPATKSWLQKVGQPLFGFPSIVRFSWQTTKTLLDTKAFLPVNWGDEDEFVSSVWEEDDSAETDARSSKRKKTTNTKDPAQPTLSFIKSLKDPKDASQVLKDFGVSAYAVEAPEC
nr:ribonuclease H2 subunit A [Andalucia godoyi]|eukprot:ANDGO_01493.mRNA.1 Ribonuclease H2 subunit A